MFLRALFCILVVACARATPSVNPDRPAPTDASSPHPADAALLVLADAFEAKDQKAIQGLISDGFSGSRFWPDWSDAQWHAAAVSLRGATLRTSAAEHRVYSVSQARGDRDVNMVLDDGHWRLDYNSFQGPFPHM